MTLIHQDIEQLLVDCNQGNRNAQLEVYNRYYKAMYNTAYRILRNSEDAEDVMQEAFLTAFSRLSTLRAYATFGVWLKRIVVNQSIQHYNALKNLNETSINDTLYKLSEENDQTDACEEVSRNVKLVMRSINELKENYRLSLTLHLIEGYDYDEISEIMNVTAGNCRTMISRAKDSLRAKLEPIIN